MRSFAMCFSDRLKIGLPQILVLVTIICPLVCFLTGAILKYEIISSKIIPQFITDVQSLIAVGEQRSSNLTQVSLGTPPNLAPELRHYALEENQPATSTKATLEEVERKDLEPKLEPKKILIWAKYWSQGEQAWKQVFYRHFSNGCRVSDCDFLFDHKHIKEADAVLFHLVDYKPSSVPAVRNPKQFYVAFSVESPGVVLRQTTLPNTSNLFNLTMSYRRDSDVVVPYGRLLPKEASQPSVEDHDYWTGKKISKLIVWFVSKCKTQSKREDYVRELQRHVPVDIYGVCGPLKCGGRTVIVNARRSDPCEDILESYMFYLAFESNLCWDYVTEKLYRGMSHSTIPVVFGGANYSDIIPPGSYISALDFLNPKDLADYLQKVASSPDLFNSFHRWKTHYNIEIGQPFATLICDLCARLHGKTEDIEFPPKQLVRSDGRKVTGRENGSYPDFYSWFIDEGQCVYWDKTTMTLKPWYPPGRPGRK